MVAATSTWSKCVGALLVIVRTVSASAASLPLVDLGYAVHQPLLDDSGKYAYYNFSNIRYAAPPVRFAAPSAPASINRTLNTGDISGDLEPVCPQASPAWEATASEWIAALISGYTPEEFEAAISASATETLNVSSIASPVAGTTEDCLFLDVITPLSIFETQNQTLSPVVVWIFGGGYANGAKASSGVPSTLISRARDDNQTGIVYVALNYRLGLFGWLAGSTYQDQDGISNLGLYDQRLALQWVQDYIHLFGGDPAQVTVMGESAGAGSIMHQITAYGGSNGSAPFQKAILQSPGWAPLPTDSQQEVIWETTLQYARTFTGQNITTLADLRALSLEQLYYINAIVVGVATYSTFGYGPTVDGVFVPDLPGSLIREGLYDTTVQVMLGHNSDEGLFFADPAINNASSLNTHVAAMLPPTTSPSTLTYITETLYPPIYNGSYPYTDTYTRLKLMIAELSFTCNARYLAKASPQNATYAYYFNESIYTLEGTIHGYDVAYTFFDGDTTTLDDGLEPVNATVATVLQDYITNFVMRGTPNEDEDEDEYEKGVGASASASAPWFPPYGANSSTTVVADTGLGDVVVDTAANRRCEYWQSGVWYQS